VGESDVEKMSVTKEEQERREREAAGGSVGESDVEKMSVTKEEQERREREIGESGTDLERIRAEKEERERREREIGEGESNLEKMSVTKEEVPKEESEVGRIEPEQPEPEDPRKIEEGLDQPERMEPEKEEPPPERNLENSPGDLERIPPTAVDTIEQIADPMDLAAQEAPPGAVPLEEKKNYYPILWLLAAVYCVFASFLIFYTEWLEDASLRFYDFAYFIPIPLVLLIIIPLIIHNALGVIIQFILFIMSCVFLVGMFFNRTRVFYHTITLTEDMRQLQFIKSTNNPNDWNIKILKLPSIIRYRVDTLIQGIEHNHINIFLLMKEGIEKWNQGNEAYSEERAKEFFKALSNIYQKSDTPLLPPIIGLEWEKGKSTEALEKIRKIRFSHIIKSYSIFIGIFEAPAIV